MEFAKGKFLHIKVSDQVWRRLGGLPMPLKVKEVDEKVIYCTPIEADWPIDECWKFDRETGVEIDERFGWGPDTGVTGSYLEDDREKDQRRN